MRLPGRALAAYLAGAALLSSVTVAYEWASPIDTPEGPWDWYRRFGVVNGAFVGGGHVAPGGGFILEVHPPRFAPFPFLSYVGPESGGLVVAVWFVFVCLAIAHAGVCRYARSSLA